MKVNLSKMWRCGLSLLLALCLVVGVCPSVAYAAGTDAGSVQEEKLSYVSIGDSMANGYGLEGYYEGADKQWWGYAQTDVESYPVMVAREKGWELTQLAISGFRAREVYYLLGGDTVYADEYCVFHVDDRCNDISDIGQVRKEYQTAVKNADVISIGLGTNNFGTFFTSRLQDYMTNSTPYVCDLEALLNSVDAGLAKEATAYETQLLAKMNEIIADYGITDPTVVGICNDLANAAVYTLADFIISYKGVLDYIAVNNPDAEVIIVGLNNAMDDMYLTMEGMEEPIDLSSYYGYIVELANAYMYGLPAAYDVASQLDSESAYDLTVYFAPISNVEQIAQTYTEASVKGSSVIRDRFIEEINDMAFGLIENAVKDMFTLTDVTREQINGYETLGANYLASAGVDSYASVAMYKAFETASIRAAQKNTLDGAALAALPGALTGENDLFGEVMAAFQAEVEKNASKVFDEAVAIVVKQASDEKITADVIKTAYENETTLDGLDVKATVNGLITLLSLETAMTTALSENATISSLLNLFARYKIGEGMGCHPSVAGHVTVKNAVIAAYDNGHTATDEVVERAEIALEALYDLLEEYGPEVAAQVWASLEEAGYVDYINNSINELEAALTERYNSYVETVIPAINASIEELNAQADSLKAELAALQAELAAKKAELEAAAGDVAEELAEAIAQLEAAIASVEAAIVAVEENIADLEALANELIAAVAKLDTQLTDLAAAVKDLDAALEVLFAVLTDAEGTTTEALIAAYNAARDTVLAAAEVLDHVMAASDALVNDIAAMAAALNEKVVGLYEMVIADLEEAYNNLSPEEQAAIAEAIAAVNAALEEAKAQVMAELEAALAELEAEYAPLIEAKKAELEALKQQIEDEIAAKYEETKAAIEAQVAELTVQAEELKAQAEALKAELEEAAEEAKAEIQAQIAALEAQIAAIEVQIAALQADLEAALDNIRADVEAAYAEAVAALEEAIAELEDTYYQLVEEVTAAADAKLQELIAEAEAKLEELGAAGEAVSEIVTDIYNQVREEIAAVNTAVKDLLTGAAENVDELIAAVEALADETAAAVETKVEELVAAVEAAFEKATTADMVIDDDFKYAAIGDASAVSESYVDKLAAALNAEAAENGVDEIEVVNYAKAGNTVAAERANLSDIADADLITVGFGNVTFLHNALQGKVTMDWAALIGEENVPYVDQLMADVEAEIAANGLNAEMTAYLSGLVEAYAYSAVEYAVELPALINEINAVNPDAVVIIVGMYNPMDGVSVVVDGVAVNVGEYVDYLVEGVAVHGIAYAMLTGNAIYVDARDVDTVNTDIEITLPELTTMAMNQFTTLYPTQVGYDYIAAQLANALNITYVATEVPVLYGDVNDDGVVDSRDLVRLTKHFAQTEGSVINEQNSDVNVDGEINSLDLVRLTKYFAQVPGVVLGN